MLAICKDNQLTVFANTNHVYINNFLFQWLGIATSLRICQNMDKDPFYVTLDEGRNVITVIKYFVCSSWSYVTSCVKLLDACYDSITLNFHVRLHANSVIYWLQTCSVHRHSHCISVWDIAACGKSLFHYCMQGFSSAKATKTDPLRMVADNTQSSSVQQVQLCNQLERCMFWRFPL